jgi:hypothetical protein
MEKLSTKYDPETLNYLYYLRNYAYNLEKFLHREIEEKFVQLYPEYMDRTPKRITIPMELPDALRIQNELDQVRLRIAEIQKFNTHD